MNRNVLQAIADLARRERNRRLSANVIANHFTLSRGLLSGHIQLLYKGSVASGETHYRSLARPVKLVPGWLEAFRNLWKERLNNLDELLNQSI